MCTYKIGVYTQLYTYIEEYNIGGVYTKFVWDDCYTDVTLVTQQCVYSEECACLCHVMQCVCGMSVYKMHKVVSVCVKQVERVVCGND